MKIRDSAIIVFILLLGAVLLNASLGTANPLKDRMRGRLPAIKALKSQGVVGENNQGLLAFMKASPENEALIKEENRDRQTVYEAIARKNKTTAIFVGKNRAAQIRDKAHPGEWLQDEAGSWRQK